MSQYTIEVGDIVSVDFEHCNSIFNAKVLYRPQATGDSWVLDEAGKIIYVQLFSRMTLVQKNEEQSWA